MSNLEYPIPAAPVIFEEEIKKSRFITRLAHTPSVETAKEFINSIKREFCDARHNCWAFVAGAPDDSMQYGFSDDSEPSGTAGKPMLNQLIGSRTGEITAVTTRYSGGIKLGTGGLVKAYGGGVQQALLQLQTETRIATKKLQFKVPFTYINSLEQSVKEFSAEITERVFTEQIHCTVLCPVKHSNAFCKRLNDLSKGQIELITT